ncbi:MAG: DNA cytosine methyltransferase [Betaproteobacteria bacterium]|nr:MAG: DNA cytosine methyltransferase [Betaproteobacteria bacterium]
MRELALFAGAGGGILGGTILGWRTVCAVELDAYAATVLVQRQNDGLLPAFPVWSDIETFDGRPWRGRVDVVSGGFPCQDISAAGRGAGIEGKRSGLWVEMARVIREVRPRFAFVENSPVLTTRGLGRVLGDLAAMGFDARWGVFGACHAGAPHERERIWIVADDSQYRCGPRRSRGFDSGGAREPEYALQDVADSTRFQQGRSEQRPEWERAGASSEQELSYACIDERDGREEGAGRRSARQAEDGRGAWRGSHARTDWWLAEPDVGRVADGVADRVDRLKAIGNGQVPAVAALAWRTLTQDWFNGDAEIPGRG